MASDVKRLTKALAKTGWRQRRKKRVVHQFFYCPCGDHTVTVAVSPGPRSVRNTWADAMRCGQTREELRRWRG